MRKLILTRTVADEDETVLELDISEVDLMSLERPTDDPDDPDFLCCIGIVHEQEISISVAAEIAERFFIDISDMTNVRCWIVDQ